MRPLHFLPPLTLLVYRAITHKSLTPLATITAFFTGLLHASHPSPLPFVSLCTFFLLGTGATKAKERWDRKRSETSEGSRRREEIQKTHQAVDENEGESKDEKEKTKEGPRDHIQVLANSGAASLLLLIWWCCVFHWGDAAEGDYDETRISSIRGSCFKFQAISSQSTTAFQPESINTPILFSIAATYASVTADTLSSELGVLISSWSSSQSFASPATILPSPSPRSQPPPSSSSTPTKVHLLKLLHQPRLITDPFGGPIPSGTNGGVTLAGLLSGFFGALVVGSVDSIFLCSTGHQTTMVMEISRRLGFIVLIALLGTVGSILDSLLGAMVQATVFIHVVMNDAGSKSESEIDIDSDLTNAPSQDENGMELARRRKQNPHKDSASSSSSSSSSNLPHLHLVVEEGINGRRATTNTIIAQDDKLHHHHHRKTFGEEKTPPPSPSPQPTTSRKISRKTQRIIKGRDWLDNNEVNFVMALIMALVGVGVGGLLSC